MSQSSKSVSVESAKQAQADPRIGQCFDADEVEIDLGGLSAECGTGATQGGNASSGGQTEPPVAPPAGT